MPALRTLGPRWPSKALACKCCCKVSISIPVEPLAVNRLHSDVQILVEGCCRFRWAVRTSGPKASRLPVNLLVRSHVFANSISVRQPFHKVSQWIGGQVQKGVACRTGTDFQVTYRHTPEDLKLFEVDAQIFQRFSSCVSSQWTDLTQTAVWLYLPWRCA